MLSQSFDQYADSPRAKLFWFVIAIVVLAQLVAIYMLCNQQVGQAHARDTAAQIQRTALADCLENVPNSTIGSCAKQVNTAGLRARAQRAALAGSQDAGESGRTAVAGAVPVSFTYR
jgi:hypothetical protein